MITANQKKFVKSLAQKKFRIQHKCFVVEGPKLVAELLLSDYKIHSVYALKEWIENNPLINAEVVSNKDLEIMSSFKTANEVIAVARYKDQQSIKITEGLLLGLDNIQDPGNLGTIIRTADWFNIKDIVCSTDSVDNYNPKAIQATMGSIFRVNIHYVDLVGFLSNNSKLNVYGALLEGENVYSKKLTSKNSLLLMGNESKGISESLLPFIKEKISIPRKGKAESLNVAAATAILCAEFAK